MANVVQQMEDDVIRHQVYILRLSSSQAAQMIAIIDTSIPELAGALAIWLQSARKGQQVLILQDRQFNRLQREVSKIRGSAIAKSKAAYTKELAALVAHEIGWAEGLFIDNIPVTIPYTVPDPKKVAPRLIKNASYSGATVDQWFTNLRQNDVDRIMSTVRFGVTQGLSNDDIVRSVVGTRSLNFTDGVVNTTRNDATRLVRTITNGMANDARASFAVANAELLQGERYTATLDGRTSLICISLDGTIVPVGGQPRPPQHPNSVKGGTMITTKRGLVKIEDVKVGDCVLTHMGRYRRVYAVMAKQCDTPMVDLVNNFGESISLTNDHPVLTKCRGWQNAGNIDKSDILFQNFDKFLRSECSDSRPYVEHTILINSHNMESEVSQELVSLGIFGNTAGMSSSIKLNQNISNFEISDILPNRNLELKTNSFFCEELNKKPLMESRVGSVIHRPGICNFFLNFFRFHRVLCCHTFRRFLATLSVLFRVFSAPMIIAGWLWNKLTISPNRLSFASDLHSFSDCELSQSVIREPMTSFKKSKALTSFPMVFNEFCVKVRSLSRQLLAHNYSPTVNKFVYSGNILNVEQYNYDGMVYNLSVEEDETYIADSFLVHNCRSTMVPIVDTGGLLDEIGERPFVRDSRTRRKRQIDFRKDAKKKAGNRWTGLTTSQRNRAILREKRKWAKENIGTVPAATTYVQWLRKQPTEFQNEVLGKRRAQLWRSGKVKIDKFVDRSGKVLTLEQLQKIEG